ncbi:MAG: hypothetical protein ACYC6N_12680 [Pirellulaceae bacterium]
MRRLGVCIVFCVVLSAGLGWVQVRSADAYLTFSKAFLKRYAADKSSEAQKSVASEFARVKKCGVCHDPRPGADGKISKKNRNPYGQALAKHLTEKDKKDAEKALEMLSKIEGEKAEGSEKTFGELLASGKLPFLYEGFDYAGGKDDEKDEE